MTDSSGQRIASIALIYLGAIVAGGFATWLRVPLPWMIGPMVFTGIVAACQSNVGVPGITRSVGQVIVAAAVGFSFTPTAVSAIGDQIVPILAAALLTVLAGFLVAMMLMRLTGVDVISASLASVPGGPVEMAALASQYGTAPSPVAFTQTLRIVLLVLIVPPALVAINGGSPDAMAVVLGGGSDYAGMVLLLGLACLGGLIFRLLRISSPFFLGALGFSAAAAALELPVAMPPYWLLALAQILLGVWLGCMFDRDMLARSKRFVPAAIASTMLLLVLCLAMAFAISAATGTAWQTMILATAPGSVTEMALTAKILQQGVALVTAYHVVRIFIIIPSAPLIFAVTARLAGRSRDPDSGLP